MIVMIFFVYFLRVLTPIVVLFENEIK